MTQSIFNTNPQSFSGQQIQNLTNYTEWKKTDLITLPVGNLCPDPSFCIWRISQNINLARLSLIKILTDLFRVVMIYKIDYVFSLHNYVSV